jgi:agmatine/peptidylarginine deiminase
VEKSLEQKSFNKRLIAEWETQEFVQLMFPHSQSDWSEYLDEVLPVFEEIAQSIAKYQPCIVCYMEEKSIQNIKNKENIILKKVASNDTWCRDFGGITILNGDKIEVLDYIFNGWGNKFDASLDNQITKELFCDLRSYDFVLEGGSIDSNGDGVVITTSECLLEKNRNPSFTKEQITAKLKDDLGIKELIWIENGYLEGDDTDSHIDMLARFVDKNTIVYQTCGSFISSFGSFTFGIIVSSFFSSSKLLLDCVISSFNSLILLFKILYSSSILSISLIFFSMVFVCCSFICVIFSDSFVVFI